MLKVLLAVLTLASLVGVLLVPSAQGEEGAQAPSLETWMFDVRIVRVDAPTPEAVETAAPWEAAGSCTTDASWPELLTQLKARGRTQVLLDQRITSLVGMEALASQSSDRLIEQMQSRDLSNERWSSAPIITGGTAKLRVSDPDVLTYQLEARWEIRSTADNVRPLMRTSKWAGTFRAIPNGGTLALTYREQIQTWGDARVGTEIHAFLTMRRLPLR